MTTKSELHPFFKYARNCGSPKLFYYALYYLTAVLIVGTVTQADLGIYGAQERYFSAWVTMAMDMVPIPGGRLTLLLISFNLTVKLLFRSHWSIRNLGINIAHIGMLLLMIGALLTAYFSVEGSMFIKEGSSASFYVDSTELALKVIDSSEVGADQVVAFSGPYLSVGADLRHQRWPGVIRVLEWSRNATVELCDPRADGNWRGFARTHRYSEKNLEKESNANVGVMIVEVSGFDEPSNGRYMITEANNSAEHISVEGKDFRLSIGPRVYRLPHHVRFELIDFKAEYHPGTGMPSGYSSRLRIHEEGTEREALISMNEPLRMHGHTFYQSSFQQMNGEEATILSVVENYGRMFPYISSIVMCIGLAIHLLLHYTAFSSSLAGGRSQAKGENG